MKKYKINKNKKKELPKFPVGYGSLVVMLPYPVNPREGKCDACSRDIRNGTINRTALHHWIYAYKHKTVKKDPFLVLDNCSELCWGCHKNADALRTALTMKKENLWMLVKTALLMPQPLKEKLDYFCRQYLEARKGDKKAKLEEYFEEE